MGDYAPALKAANLTIRFVLEICLLAMLAYWGLTVFDGALAVFLGIAAPLSAAVVWGVFVSPRARVSLPVRTRVVFSLVLFAVGAMALTAAGHPVLAGLFALIAAVNTALVYIWKQSEALGPAPTLDD